MKSSLLVTCGLAMSALCSFAVIGCDDGHHGHDHEAGSEIVFGIEQSQAADGTTQTSVDYEYLDVLNQGWSAVGIVNRSESCWAEVLDDRLGKPAVAGGVATFTGAALPANGIAVIANSQGPLVLPAAGWTAGGSPLTFQSQGFAMPTIAPAVIYTPVTSLTITSPSDPATNVAITVPPNDGYSRHPSQASSATDFTVTWNVDPETAGPSENVVASINAVPASTPNAQGVELRCFFDRQAGTGTFPAELVAQFYDLVTQGDSSSSTTAASTAPVTGTLHFATHRQLTIEADGGWTVYVTAMVDQRQQAFTLAP